MNPKELQAQDLYRNKAMEKLKSKKNISSYKSPFIYTTVHWISIPLGCNFCCLYPNNFKTWFLDRVKAPGKRSRKSPNISNIRRLARAIPKALTLARNQVLKLFGYNVNIFIK